MRQIDEEAVKASQDKRAEELFIANNRAFILRCASKHTKKFVTVSDDEWSVAMIAFSEALNAYDAGKGAFLPFADLVIGRRLQSYLRAERKFAGEMPVNPSVFEGCVEEDTEDTALQAVVLSQIVSTEDRTTEYEIEALSGLLAEYGFSFHDLVSCSPKAEKTKKSCAAAIQYILGHPLILSEMRRAKVLPLKAVSLGSGVTVKILERHRKYIIASTEILNGEFPSLFEYLSDIKAAAPTEPG
ncbi:MAG: hypothetical protein AB7E30_09160 [Lawsonibacter sp.]